MSIKLYTLKYNNYFNRKVLKESSLDDYLTSSHYTIGHLTDGVSFDVRDGVETTQIINYTPNGDDYAVLVNGTTILSRWFILEADKQRTGQYLLTLKRDVIVDYYDDLENAPIFVQKGHLNSNDSMICNDEGMLLNRIKNKETLLKDNTNVAWLVGYITKEDLSGGKTEVTVTSNTAPTSTYYTPAQIATAVGNITEAQLIALFNIGDDAVTNKFYMSQDVELNYGYEYSAPIITGGGPYKFSLLFDKQLLNASISLDLHVLEWSNKVFECDTTISSLWPNAATKMNSIWGDPAKMLALLNASSADKFVLSEYQWDILKNYEGKRLLYNGNYYKITFNGYSAVRSEFSISSEVSQATYFLNQYLTEFPNEGIELLTGGTLYIWANNNEKAIVLQPVDTNAYHIPFASATNRKDCQGSVCDIFAIPFGGFRVAQYDSHTPPQIDSWMTIRDKELLLKFASTIATELSSQLYDFQLLPYCPIPLIEDYHEDLAGDCLNMTENKDFDYIYSLDENENHIKQSIIYWLNSANYSTTIRFARNVSNRKVESQTKMCRLCSPTGNGSFDFNIAKNNGIDYLNINVTYKPYTPYIQVLPNFKGLYGGNFNDYRGLICGGDFSFTRVSDKWVEYQLANKNYQNIFNREIMNLDLTQSQQKLTQGFKVGAGVVGGGVAGGMAGAKAGPYGAIAGAVIGTGVGAVGGALDWNMAEQMRYETKDYAMDKFSFQLGNIQAMPNTLTKVDSFVANSKLFPFAEEYECTREETTALINKITYDGMSVERIGTISEFASGTASYYFKGQLIRCDDIHEDAHLVNTIYDELLKGVYV